MKNPEKVQFNPRIDPKYKRMVKVDAAKTNQTIECVAETMIARFFYFYPTKAERKKAYQEHLQINKLKQNSDPLPH